MKRFTLVIIWFLPLLSNGQTRMILNDSVFVVMQDSVKLVIENGNSNAITELNKSSMIISENEKNEVIWHIKESVGQTYIVPFGTTPSVQGGTETRIPFVLTTQIAGVEDSLGRVTMSTWETANDNNTPLPVGVSGLADGFKAVDRFWAIFPSGYSTTPQVNLTFIYDDNPNEIGGSNTLAEANLSAQGYNNQSGSWLEYGGTANSTDNYVENVNLSSSQFNADNWLWTLVEGSVVLSLRIDEFTMDCDGESTHLSWSVNSAPQNEIKVQHSIDGDEWLDFEYLDNQKGEITYSSNSIHDYVRLSVKDSDEQIFSPVAFKDCPLDNAKAVRVYPNPAQDLVHIKVGEGNNFELQVFESTGKLVSTGLLLNSGSDFTLDLTGYANGVYYLRFSSETDNQSIRLLKQK